MNRLFGYVKIGLILVGIYTLFTREYLFLACRRFHHRKVAH
ncbi:MAG: hypothetical protein ACU843_00450 [Gammaproteobacteria bacterium]